MSLQVEKYIYDFCIRAGNIFTWLFVGTSPSRSVKFFCSSPTIVIAIIELSSVADMQIMFLRAWNRTMRILCPKEANRDVHNNPILKDRRVMQRHSRRSQNRSRCSGWSNFVLSLRSEIRPVSTDSGIESQWRIRRTRQIRTDEWFTTSGRCHLPRFCRTTEVYPSFRTRRVRIIWVTFQLSIWRVDWSGEATIWMPFSNVDVLELESRVLRGNANAF